MIQQANTDILDIETNHRKDILSTDLKNSLCQIELETSAIYSDLCTWKASHTRPPAGASKEHAAAVETKHTTLTKSPELNQGRDTKGVSTVTQDLTSYGAPSPSFSGTPLTDPREETDIMGSNGHVHSLAISKHRPPPKPPLVAETDFNIGTQTCSPLPIPMFRGRTTTTSLPHAGPHLSPHPGLFFQNSNLEKQN